MKRIVPSALLALAAFVVLPVKIVPTTSRALSPVPAGIDRAPLEQGPQAAGPSRLDTVDVDLFDRPDGTALALVDPHADRGELRDALAPTVSDGKIDPVPSGRVSHPGEPLAKGNGSTPANAASMAEGSVTPRSASTAIAWVTPTGIVVMLGKEAEQPRLYVGLIEPAQLEREQRCLAEAVYFEARSEAEDGRAAIAQVVLNRVKSGVYPHSVCGVVYQNRHRKLACQFTFACEGKSLRITEPEAWKAALRIARDVYEGRIYLAEVGGATHYHADYVQPSWARKLKKMDAIGRHIFYS
ncbi:Cell wall hydrolase [Hyphomicrobiales bacterium]|nr:Cell wall hydrolase [Hyphomicrobiales bacterium]CAH1700607.1 Cell wall hydrolase [Hyphomicrobiales bacterium]CAI0344455.1 N-acetylmuramoyl-L-alanine amidase [Hyphomicrobiales bacterium]